MRYVIVPALLIATLLAFACDDDGEETRATATPTAEIQTTTATATPEPAVETLAFIRDGDIWLIGADGSDERRLNLTDVQSFTWISPDELDVVTGGDPPGHLLVDLEGNVRELFFPGDFHVAGGLSSAQARGSWSSDGSLFVVPVGEQLVIYDKSGDRVRQLDVEPPPVPDDPTTFCDEPGSKQETAANVFGSPIFTPDNKSILVAIFCASRNPEGDLSFPRNTFSRLYRVSLDSGAVEPLQLSTNLRSDSRPRFSPDNSRIALPGSNYGSTCSLSFGLSVADADGTDSANLTLPELEELYGQENLTEVGGGPFGGIMGFDWSPQSDAIVASVDASICKDFTPQQALAGLYILRLNGSPGEQLMDGPSGGPAWAPSGRFIAFALPTGGESTIRLIDPVTKEAIDLAEGTRPAWQPQP
jgi:hypothetical protein